MERKYFGIVFALIFGVCFGIFVQKAFAASSPLVISEVKTGGSETEHNQFVELYNDSSEPVDMSGFVLEYAKPNAQIDGGCTAAVWQDLTTPTNIHSYDLANFDQTLIQPHGHLTIDISMNDNVGGSVRLAQTITSTVVYDLVGWGDADSNAPCAENTQAPIPTKGKSIKRQFDNDGHPVDTDSNATDFVLSDTPTPETDLPPIPGKSAAIPCDNKVELSEFLTDPVGLEANGGEFVELYNPGDNDANLFGCHLKSSHSTSDLVTFLDTDIVPAHQYFVVPLINKLTNKQGNISFETANQKEVVDYSNMDEGQSDSLIGSKWQITDKPTPNKVNQLVNLTDEQVEQASLAPCPSGKFRNPATNRCKNIKSKSEGLKPCASNQYRNTVTNRCRLISAAVSSSLKPCAADQKRNPITNRCRKIVTASSKLSPCKVGYTRNAETHRCRKNKSGSSFAANLSQPASINSAKTSPTVALVVGGLALGYGIYEYRQEIWRGWRYLRGLVFKPSDSS